jgi:drug/metabolite transporter (DMT)-like permease
MNPILLILIASISLGFAEAFNSHKMKVFPMLSSTGLILIGTFISFFLDIAYVFTFDVPIENLTLIIVLQILVIGIIFYAANKLFYQSYKEEDASIVAVLGMVSIVATSILGKVLFKEQMSTGQWFGIVLIIIAVFLINTDGQKDRFSALKNLNKAKINAMLAGLLYGIGFSISKFLLLDFNPHYYQLISPIFIVPLIFIFDFRSVKKQIPVIINKKILLNFSWIIILYYIYNKLRFVAMSDGIELPIADAIDNSVVFIIILVELFILKIPQENILRKVLISLIAFVGILLVSIT